MDYFRSRIHVRVRDAMAAVTRTGLWRGLFSEQLIRQVRAIRAIGENGSASERSRLCESLEDLAPCIRKNAADSLGRNGNIQVSSLLLGSARIERCDMPRFAKCVAAVRCGASVDEAWQILAVAAQRTFNGFYGLRRTADLSGWGIDKAGALWRRALTHEQGSMAPGEIVPEPMDEIRRMVLRAVEQNPDDRDAVLVLGLLGHPDDFEVLIRLTKACGRRMHLTLCTALGYHGDPGAIRWLLEVLQAMDVDPGHGFASRAAAAAALGCMGIPDVSASLVRALENEALDYEGHPGAGLGIQQSVRTSILCALGELQARPDTVEAYLANTHGSAAGGFYLPAMDALWKIGDADRMTQLCAGPEEVAVNARAVLEALQR